MIDYEMIVAREAIAQTGTSLLDVQASFVAIYLTMIFAYLSAAYFVGKELTRFQLAIVTFLFTAAAGRQVFLITFLGRVAREKGRQLRDLSESAPDLAAESSILWPIAIWSSGIIASLLFMWSIRNSKAK